MARLASDRTQICFVIDKTEAATLDRLRKGQDRSRSSMIRLYVQQGMERDAAKRSQTA